jgi:hypothetical protein
MINKELEVSKDIANMYLMNHLNLTATLRQAAIDFSKKEKEHERMRRD